MQYLKKIPRNDYMPEKGSGYLLTSKGNTNKLVEIIKQLDPGEFRCYGTVDGSFVIPVYEELEVMPEANNVLVPSQEFYGDYYGKFEIDLKKLYAVCDKQNIPVVFVATRDCCC